MMNFKLRDGENVLFSKMCLHNLYMLGNKHTDGNNYTVYWTLNDVQHYRSVNGIISNLGKEH